MIDEKELLGEELRIIRSRIDSNGKAYIQFQYKADEKINDNDLWHDFYGLMINNDHKKQTALLELIRWSGGVSHMVEPLEVWQDEVIESETELKLLAEKYLKGKR